jgi:hypothetical protein
METYTPRQPKGVRAGGQFAATEHAEPSLTSLSPVVDERHIVGVSPVAKRELMGPGTLSDRNPAWTPTALKKFLGEPDKLVRNPVYRNAPQMRMFLTSRVEEVEDTDEWRAWEDGYRRRSAANGRKKPEEEKTAPKVELGQGRNGYYPVVRR